MNNGTAQDSNQPGSCTPHLTGSDAVIDTSNVAVQTLISLSLQDHCAKDYPQMQPRVLPIPHFWFLGSIRTRVLLASETRLDDMRLGRAVGCLAYEGVSVVPI